MLVIAEMKDEGFKKSIKKKTTGAGGGKRWEICIRKIIIF